MDRASTLFMRLAAALFALSAIWHFGGATTQPVRTAHAASYSYTAHDYELATIVNWTDHSDGHTSNWPNWPEQESNWCGLAVMQAIVKYAWWKYGHPDQNNYTTQNSIEALLNWQSGGPDPMSPWGLSQYGQTFRANISGDGGLDPRGEAWGLYTATPYGYYYHNYIYPYSNTVTRATQNLASDYGSRGLNNPVAVMVNGGLHIVIVSGVVADRDPSVDPSGAQIQQIDIWDPWYGTPDYWGGSKAYNTSNVHQWWNIGDWTGTTGIKKWWFKTYQSNGGYDPEPYTAPGNYYNVPPLPQHWDNGWVTVEQDTIPPSTWDENIALNNIGQPVPHN